MSDIIEVSLHASGPEVITGNSADMRIAGPPGSYRGGSVLSVLLDVTAVAGTDPTLDVDLLAVFPNGATISLGAFTQKTGTGQQLKFYAANVPPANVRAVWTIGGTGGPSFTFSLQLTR